MRGDPECDDTIWHYLQYEGEDEDGVAAAPAAAPEVPDTHEEPQVNEGRGAFQPSQRCGSGGFQPGQSCGSESFQPRQSSGNDCFQPRQSCGSGGLQPSASSDNTALPPRVGTDVSSAPAVVRQRRPGAVKRLASDNRAYTWTQFRQWYGAQAGEMWRNAAPDPASLEADKSEQEFHLQWIWMQVNYNRRLLRDAQTRCTARIARAMATPLVPLPESVGSGEDANTGQQPRA